MIVIVIVMMVVVVVVMVGDCDDGKTDRQAEKRRASPACRQASMTGHHFTTTTFAFTCRLKGLENEGKSKKKENCCLSIEEKEEAITESKRKSPPKKVENC